ncbi:hypothetical protein PAXRUDRAFT_789100 [Paxillus rubicundulus Ve08.2h10]|uniref:Unplaced genomic scaffold scaffold_380, whole genome shotgun sequence n=1 Tax=Paxillus rubicundulus Ve08.2h10 TaxID=930991 RepID=A0A0D0D8C7_9AGAM|nr:hypothetical protein PAXRUDRAFT_789100 [Paxillus rubicundulus Ve08.2h10]
MPSSSVAAKSTPSSSFSKIAMAGSDNIDPRPTNVKIPKPQVFTDWLQHVQMYFSFYSNCTEKERILITLSLMNQGYANTWSSAYYRKEEAKSGTKIDWDEFICALKELFSPINKTGLAHTHLRELKQGNTLTDQFVTMFEQLMVEAGYGSVRNDSWTLTISLTS